MWDHNGNIAFIDAYFLQVSLDFNSYFFFSESNEVVAITFSSLWGRNFLIVKFLKKISGNSVLLVKIALYNVHNRSWKLPPTWLIVRQVEVLHWEKIVIFRRFSANRCVRCFQSSFLSGRARKKYKTKKVIMRWRKLNGRS